MINYLLLFLLPFSLYASKILSYNIYERTDRDDVMITFDTPYNGTIKQSIGKSKIVIKLEKSSIESSKTKRIDSSYLHALYITPMKNYTKITASVSPDTQLLVSKTSDSYGLRLRFLTKKGATEIKQMQRNTTTLPTKKDIQISNSYYIVVTLLILAIIILLVLKKKIQLPRAKTQKDSWLFKSNNTTPTQLQQEEKRDVSIRFQKSIDKNNSVVMLDFGTQSYLVLMGNSNILLDTFNEDKPSSQAEFESVLQSRHDELEQFLGNKEVLSSTTKEPLQSYKERAASLIYSDET